MKKINNKGVTLIELIVSFAIVGVAIIYFFQTLFTVKNVYTTAKNETNAYIDKDYTYRILDKYFDNHSVFDTTNLCGEKSQYNLPCESITFTKYYNNISYFEIVFNGSSKTEVFYKYKNIIDEFEVDDAGTNCYDGRPEFGSCFALNQPYSSDIAISDFDASDPKTFVTLKPKYGDNTIKYKDMRIEYYNNYNESYTSNTGDCVFNVNGTTVGDLNFTNNHIEVGIDNSKGALTSIGLQHGNFAWHTCYVNIKCLTPEGSGQSCN